MLIISDFKAHKINVFKTFGASSAYVIFLLLFYVCVIGIRFLDCDSCQLHENVLVSGDFFALDQSTLLTPEWKLSNIHANTQTHVHRHEVLRKVNLQKRMKLKIFLFRDGVKEYDNLEYLCLLSSLNCVCLFICMLDSFHRRVNKVGVTKFNACNEHNDMISCITFHIEQSTPKELKDT